MRQLLDKKKNILNQYPINIIFLKNEDDKNLNFNILSNNDNKM